MYRVNADQWRCICACECLCQCRVETLCALPEDKSNQISFSRGDAATSMHHSHTCRPVRCYVSAIRKLLIQLGDLETLTAWWWVLSLHWIMRDTCRDCNVWLNYLCHRFVISWSSQWSQTHYRPAVTLSNETMNGYLCWPLNFSATPPQMKRLNPVLCHGCKESLSSSIPSSMRI